MAGMRAAPVGFDLALSGTGMETMPIDVQAATLVDTLRGQFDAQGELAPSDGHLIALARVAAGFLRTSPLSDTATEDGTLSVLQSFVATTFGWWTRDQGDDARIAALLDDVFRQRETPVPDAAALDMLVTVTSGLLRRRNIPSNANAPQLAIADWLASLYLAGLDDW